MRRFTSCRALERTCVIITLFTLCIMIIKSEIHPSAMDDIAKYTKNTFETYVNKLDHEEVRSSDDFKSEAFHSEAKSDDAPSGSNSEHHNDDQHTDDDLKSDENKTDIQETDDKAEDHLDMEEKLKAFENYSESLRDLLLGKLKPAEEVRTPVPGAINLGLVLVNLGKDKLTNKIPDYSKGFPHITRRMFLSMFDRMGMTPLHIIIVTDKDSAVWAGQLVGRLVIEKLAKDVIQRRYWKWKASPHFPSLHFSMVDCNDFLNKNPDFVQGMMDNLMPTDRSKDKYVNTFYYMAPLYHLGFTNLDRAVFIDASDLEFTIDIKELYDQFEELDRKEKAIMMMGLDLAPHYFMFLKNYIDKNPYTIIGQPGRFQGFNTGVVLYRFDRMRADKLYNSYLTSQKVKELVDLYEYPISLAEQDFFTNLGFTHPLLFHVMSCTFNRQTSIQYLREPYLDVFDEYHGCGNKTDVKIFHLNGCGPSPKQCGNTLPPDSKYKDEDFQFIDLNMEVFWKIMQSVDTDDWSWTAEYADPNQEKR